MAKKDSAFSRPKNQSFGDYLKWTFSPSVGWSQFKEGLAGGPAPDLQADAAKQRAEGISDAEKAFRMNNPTQVTPWGESVTVIGADGNVTQRTTLNPEDQKRLDANRQFGLGIQDYGKSLLGQQFGPVSQIGNYNLSDPAAAYNQRAEDALFNRMSARLDPMWERRGESLRNQLINQGLDPSSEAYKNAMSDFSGQRNDAYSSAINDAISRSGQEASRLFGMDLSRSQANFGMDLQRQGADISSQMAGQQFGLNALGGALNTYGVMGQFNTPQSHFAQYQTPGVPNYAAISQAESANEQARNDNAIDIFKLPFEMAGTGAQVGTGLASIPRAPQTPSVKATNSAFPTKR